MLTALGNRLSFGRAASGSAVAVSPTASPKIRLTPALRFGFDDRLDIQSATFRNLSLQWDPVVPGVKHARLNLKCPRGPLAINVLQLDAGRPDLVIRPVLAGDALGRVATLPEFTRKTGMIAGVNASYFRMLPEATGLPLGTMMLDGRLITGPLYQRSTLGITRDNTFRIGRPALDGQLTSGDVKIKIDNLNQLPTPRNQSIASHAPWKEVIVYSAPWGQQAPPMEAGLCQVRIQKGKITAVSTTDTLPILEDGVVLMGPQAVLSALQKGAAAELKLALEPDWADVQSAICAGPTLIRDGKIVFIDRADETFTPYNEELGSFEPRTAAGITADGKLLMVTVDGRQPGHSVGLSVLETARLLLALGAVEALNLDGGRSTQMMVKDVLINTPASLNPLRPVPTVLGVFRSPPDKGDRKTPPDPK